MPTIAAAVPGVKLLLIGEGSERPRLQARVRELGDGAAGQGCGVAVGLLRRIDVAPELVDASDAFQVFVPSLRKNTN